MGGRNETLVQSVTGGDHLPRDDEFELTLIGPGYGESVVLHVGDGSWILIDSCGRADAPAALDYLRSIGVDPAEAVKMIVATHWHDDHIRGIAQMARVCSKAAFCCASVLCVKEFLAAVQALESRHFAPFRSGVGEIYDVFSRLREGSLKLIFASANRRVFSNKTCEVWSLSPGDDAFRDFVQSIGHLLPKVGHSETRIPSLSPNEVAVVLWIRVGDIVVVLGSDLEQRGWLKILQDTARPTPTASLFKVPHHGSESGDEPGVWQRMLDAGPVAVLTPWRRGARKLPTNRDIARILSRTETAYASAKISAGRSSRRANAVKRSIRESGVRLRRTPPADRVRLRRRIAPGTQWQVETLGTACHLREYQVPRAMTAGETS